MADTGVDAAPDNEDGLVKGLGTFGAMSMIVGIVIGSGIFLGVNRVAAGTGSPWLVVLVWVLAGVLTLLGALTYAELGTMFPKAGGEYVFLREGLGSLVGFLSGWTAFTVNLAGSAAFLAIAFAEQLNQFKPDGFAPTVLVDAGPVHITTVQVTAACLILLLSIVNYFGLRYGGGVQMVITGTKIGLVAVLGFAALLFFGDPASPDLGLFSSGHVAGTPAADGFSLSGFFGLALVAALFAYDGWTDLVRVGSEIRDPQRNIPRASLYSMLAIMALYILISIGYMHVLGFQGFADGTQVGFENERTVASNAANVLWGGVGEKVVAAMILVSVFGGLNGITLAGPRVYYAMARDRLFPRMVGRLSRHKTPHYAIFAQGGLAIVFLLFFDFNELSDNVIFVSFFFYGLTALGLMLLRRHRPDLERPYRVWGYPFVPVLYIITALTFSGYLLYDQITTLSVDNLNRLVGLLVILAGVPIYFLYRRRIVRECREAGIEPPDRVFGPPRAP